MISWCIFIRHFDTNMCSIKWPNTILRLTICLKDIYLKIYIHTHTHTRILSNIKYKCDIFTLKYGLNLLLCSISSGTWVPSGCWRNWSSNIIINLNTLRKWQLMVSPERQTKKEIVWFFTLCDRMWRNLATCSSTVTRCVSWRSPFLHKMSHKTWRVCGPMRITS